MKRLTLIIVAATVLCCTHGPAPIKTCIFPGDYPDPTILRDGEDYYMTHTPYPSRSGFLIWHSRDLVNWETLCRIPVDTQDDIWAPELCKVGDKYYLYYPTTRRENYVTCADRIEGPWSKPVLLEGARGFDPGHIVDADGRRYLYINRGRMIRLSPDGLSTEGELTKVYEGWKYPEEWVTQCMCLESPKLLKRGEWFYLVSAQGGTAGPATSHMCVVARSKSALGPWDDSPYNPLVHTYSEEEAWWSKGHGTLIDDVRGNWYIVYHGYRKDFHTLGRSTLIESVRWTEDGWPVLEEEDGTNWPSCSFADNYASLRDFSNPLLWSQRRGTFQGGTLYAAAAADTSYEVTATFSIGEDSSAGLYLFYNEQANFGKSVNSPGMHTFRILNRDNIASLWHLDNGGEWEPVIGNTDVSSLNHNRLGGFQSLRPAYLLQGDAKLVDITYR